MRVEQKAGLRGSLKWVQRLVEREPARLNRALRESGALADGDAVEWLSPREADKWAEYRDAGFLRQLGLGEHASALAAFWPSNGPQWDALGRTSDGRVFLIEAKAHCGELTSSCGASSVASRTLISRALDETKAGLGANSEADWLNGYYQYANRLAHLHFLRERGVDVRLVFLYFTGDDEMPGPNDRRAFEGAVEDVHTTLGFPPLTQIPGVVEVFQAVRELE